MTQGRIEGRGRPSEGGRGGQPRLGHVTARAAAGGQPIKRTSLYGHAESSGRVDGRSSDDRPEDRREMHYSWPTAAVARGKGGRGVVGWARACIPLGTEGGPRRVRGD